MRKKSGPRKNRDKSRGQGREQGRDQDRDKSGGRGHDFNVKRGSSESRTTDPSSSRASDRSTSSQPKSRKKIKNARGLRDVLGLGPRDEGRDRVATRRGGSGSFGGGRKPIEPQNQPAQKLDQKPVDKPKKSALASTLTYIMNFRPRGAASPAPQETKPAPAPAPARVQPKVSAKRNPEPVENSRRHQARSRSSRPSQTQSGPTSQSQSNSKFEDRAEGIIKRHPDGFGFLLPSDSSIPDVYISRQSMMGVMTNDRVEAKLYRKKGQAKNQPERIAGEIIRVISRANKKIVGKYLPVDQKYGLILDEGRGWGADLRIAAADSMQAKEGDIVAVEITNYPSEDHEFTGRVVNLIGRLEDPLNDIIRVIHQNGIPDEFSSAALSEARKFGGVVRPEETKGREDLTGLKLITIDGATAKDFDDAVWVERTGGGFRLIVAIADVSHYVKPGTALDRDAYERGTSTYFPNFVVPMLPEELSNELCSLKPNVKRLCFACEMHLNFNGEVEKYRFFEGVMESKARVTYGEAQEVIDGGDPGRLGPVKENITLAADLAKILMQKRFREGSLDLEIPETQVVVDTSGETVDIIKSERLFAHRLIEELMLVTNICTGRFFAEHEMPGIFRIHEEPDPDSIKALQRYLWNLGGSRALTGDGLAGKLTKALQEVAGRPESQVLNIMALRTMKQAQYSEGNVGHFGLGFSHYSHFTSPIRRYPDLIAHRLIKSQLDSRYKSQAMTDDELASATTMLSACEQRSVKAERAVLSIKKARFISRFVGQEFEGSISSVTKFGVFVLLRQYDVDGLIKIENLGNDRFEFDSENLRLVGQRSGLQYAIGDAVKVRVVAADPEQGRVDFDLADAPARPPKSKDQIRSEKGPTDGARKGKGLNSQKRRPTENNRRGVRKERVSKHRRKD